ncbi:MAG: ABC transporter substrate-binding protein [Oscillospiraceae bacterium]|nr:ABC transporter substrate-binding protein [Oscillospiraceae bacterium]
MLKKAKRIVALSLTLLMLLVVLSGCQGGQGDKILLFGTTGIDGNFASIMASNVYDSYVATLIFDFLIDNDAEGMYYGDIASYELSNGNRTYTFTLKDGIKFSDGQPLTSADVAFTYKTIGHPDYNGPRAYAVAGLVGYADYNSGASSDFAGIKVIDEKTIAFTFEEASPANIETFLYGIMPEHYYGFNTWSEFLALNEKPMGSGKFILEEYRPMEFVRLAANTDYWDRSKRVKIGGILMSEVPEESLLDAFATGALHVAQPQSNQDNVNAYRDMDGVTPQIILGNGYTFLCFNTLQPTLNDARVRQALMYGVDRVAFIEAVYGDMATVGLAPISPASWAFPDSGINDYAFDMDKAAALFAEAGWVKGSDGILEKDGVKMSINWLVYTDVAWPGRLAEMAYDSWGQLGVDLKIELMDFNTVAARTMDAPMDEKMNFDLYTMGFSLSIDPDPTGALFDYDAYTEGGFNASGYYNARSQELITLGKQEFDQGRRTEIYHEWARLMNEELPTVIVAYRNEIWAVSDNVKGMNISTYQTWVQNIHEITID